MVDGDALLCGGFLRSCLNVAKTLQDWRDHRSRAYTDCQCVNIWEVDIHVPLRLAEPGQLVFYGPYPLQKLGLRVSWSVSTNRDLKNKRYLPHFESLAQQQMLSASSEG